LLLVTTTVATVCERARVLDLGDGTHHADEEEAVRGLGIEGGVSGRDDPDTSRRELVEQEGEVLCCAGRPYRWLTTSTSMSPDRAAAKTCCSPGRFSVPPDAWSLLRKVMRQPGWDST
jgi:hypothetical protein